jgi:hypothetical protein
LTIKDILLFKQPDVYKQLVAIKQTVRQEKLSFCGVQELMRHDSYRRTRGSIKQARRG